MMPAYIKPNNHACDDKIQTLFDFRELPYMLAATPFKFSADFKEKIAAFSAQFKETPSITLDLLTAWKLIVCTPWSAMLVDADDLTAETKANYPTFWHYYMHHAGKLSAHAVPYHVLPSLFDVLEAFLPGAKESSLDQALLSLCTELNQCSIEQMNDFLNTEVLLGSSSLSLGYILLDIWLAPENFISQAGILMAWIGTQNPSLISDSEFFHQHYQTLKIGHFFDREALIHHYNALPVAEHEPYYELFQTLKLRLELLTDIDETILAELSKLYHARWQYIALTNDDYFQTPRGINEPWVRLALCLEGADFIESGYQLLIPSLKTTHNATTQAKLTHLPLQDYVLSEAEDELILRQDCWQYHQLHHAWAYCGRLGLRLLTALELKRLLQDESFAAYYHQVTPTACHHYLSKRTIDEIGYLIDHSVHATGFKAGEDYNPLEMTQACLGYQRFLDYCTSLTAAEHQTLYNHPIELFHKRYLFKDILQAVFEQGECVAVYGQILMKLVLDYHPYTLFKPTIEAKINLHSMRLLSAKHAYAEYAYLTEPQALARLKVIFVSLMTRQFNCLYFSGVKIKFGDFENLTTATGEKIYLLIREILTEHTTTSAVFVYAQLIEHIVKPELNKDFVTTLKRYPDTDLWLQQILANTLAHHKDIHCFEPGILHARLTYLQQIFSPFDDKMNNFVTDMIIFKQQYPTDTKYWLAVNIALQHLLKQLKPLWHERVLTSLEENLSAKVSVARFKDKHHAKPRFFARQASYENNPIIESPPSELSTLGL